MQGKKISTLLIANRGEIAVRIMRTAKAEGIRTIAVYSEADATAPHVSAADEAVCIGPAPVGDSYLRGDRVIQAALDQHADAIHPGYGFLSENSEFAHQVAAAGLIFVGPPAAAIETMGDKARAKRRMIEAGVPCVPGYEGEDQDPEVFARAANDIGYPVMVKAAAGGGGRGMRLVGNADDLTDAIRLARSEAENAFGSGELILEKAIIRPRHVEVQVFADDHGSVIHLGERDCSVQRRHQKVVEEAPCPVMTAPLREAMGSAAVEAARAVDYRGAGTVEFLLDESGSFYFLEMNTRLQVEHPVTELVTGLDLVDLQLTVAEGRPLPITQDAVRLEGHAIEVRLYAEDPADGFLPSTGPIHFWRPAEGLRTDSGIASGGEVSPYYDSMLAKVIAYGQTRDEARRKLVDGLGRTALFGTATNRDFLIDVLSQPLFAEGGATTAFIEQVYGADGWHVRPLSEEELAAVGLVEHVLGQREALKETAISAELLDWSSARDLQTVLRYTNNESAELGSDTITVRPEGALTGAQKYSVTVNGTHIGASIEELAENHAVLAIGETHYHTVFWKASEGRLFMALPARSFSLIESAALGSGGDTAAGDGQVTAPMHGLLLEVLVAVGDPVSKGDTLAVLEAMKMQHEILAEVDGQVLSVAAQAGKQIAADSLILEILPAAVDN